MATEEGSEKMNVNSDEVIVVEEGPTVVPEPKEREQAAAATDHEGSQEALAEVKDDTDVSAIELVRAVTGAVVSSLQAESKKDAPVVPKLLGFDPRLVAMFFDLVNAEAQNVPLTASTLLDLVRSAMELVEAKAVLSGTDKKRIVLHVLRAVVMRTEFESSEAKQLCITMLDSGVVSAAIDLAASASKGHLALNMPVFKKKGCCVVS